MLNYLFCLDQNYNKQLLISLNSINTHSETKFNVFIIHNEPSSLFDLINEHNITFDKVNNFQVFNTAKIVTFSQLGKQSHIRSNIL